MDQCKHCTARGDFDKCRQTPCSHRENWGFREAVEQAHMAGQMDAGCRHPGYSNARAYFDSTHNAPHAGRAVARTLDAVFGHSESTKGD